MDSKKLNFEQKGYSELEKDNGINLPSEKEEIVEIIAKVKDSSAELSSKDNNSILLEEHKNNIESLLCGKAGIDYESLPGHIIIRDGKGGGYIIKDKNEGFSEEHPDGGYYTFEEAEKLAPEGYHVPSSEEWKGLYELGIKLGFWKENDGSMFAKVLKLPYAGGTLQNRIFVYGQRFIGLYWSSSICRAMNAYSLYFKSSDINPQVDYDRSKYYSVRYFKDAK